MRPVFDPTAVHHLKHKGAVDADGHVLEDAGLWDRYIEAKYRDRALRMKRDADGLEYLPIAHPRLGVRAAAAIELERAVKDGCPGAFVVPFASTHKAHGDPAHDAIFAKAVELDVPIAIHPAFEPFELRSPRFENGHRLSLLAAAPAGDGVRQAFTTFFDFPTFDPFPKLKLLLLESGPASTRYRLPPLHRGSAPPPLRAPPPLQLKPTHNFRPQRC